MNYYTNRELSWIDFNERVLNEAGNQKVPLAERLTFASIYQSNLDEFFMVRVGTLMVQMSSTEEVRENKTGMTSLEQVEAILEKVRKLEVKKAVIYENLMKELEAYNLSLVNFNKLTEQDAKALETFFDANIAPYLSPIIVGKQQPFPFLANKELNAIVLLKNKNGKNKMGIVPCSNTIFPRLIPVPSKPGTFMLCEELILHFVSKLFEHYSVGEKSIIRITRNADIEAKDVLDEDLDYRNMMEHLVKQRKRMSPIRIELSRVINDKAKKELSEILGIDELHMINVDTPLDLKFVFELQSLLRVKKELFYKPRSPRNTPLINLKKKIIPQIEASDLLLSYPFESMKPFLNLLQEAAEDKNVVSIKMTLYRVAAKSKIIDSLIEAAENGKEVVVVVELRARFDEENNIEMSHRLEDAGCKIIYGLENYKVHSKLCLITRKVDDTLSYITQIGTGNYNEKTSTMYTDLSLITANQGIGNDAANIFKALLLGEPVDTSEHLLVAPLCLQNRIIHMIDEQIALGSEGYIGIKINSLTDKVLIDKLVEASQAGVKIQLCVRGICCLIPGVAGATENIEIISIVGRFLEHSRIYVFGKDFETQKIYIASADFMTRNTTRRVEVAAPIYDEKIRSRILHIFNTVMKDDEKGKIQCSNGEYIDRKLDSESKEKLNSQELFYEEAYKKITDYNGEI
ncbi:polyphosphate kinase 1 [Treponema sp.]|uniref:polyphosphate kinase 1 n=1 Tax=Treponema sp. TaxID=166 RepID=UPI00298E0AFE|nr:polyphosphate kinase 1 [Treponema sp.]